MKQIAFIFLVICATSFNSLAAQTQQPTTDSTQSNTISILCDIECHRYNLFKTDVNAYVDFGIDACADFSRGWIYDSRSGKRMSFASPMSAINYLAHFGWTLKDTYVVKETKEDPVVHYILKKTVPYYYTADDVLSGLDFRYN